MAETPRRLEIPWLLSLLTLGAVLGGLLVGLEAVGGDPDRMYRPLKAELARSLREGGLPFWSDRFGVGVPLVAESHVAAFYPPNLLLYSLFDVPVAYRLSMWLHAVATAGLTYLYARSIGLTPPGSWLASLAFSLCGFQAVHATHEPFYTLMPYLPLALWLSGRYVATGRFFWVALLALALGTQWTVGHFQIQMWTGALVALSGFWQAASERKPWTRALGPVAGVIWGGAVAAVQLVLSGDFALSVGHMKRPLADMAFFSFPPAHWIEPALPWFFRGLKHGGEDPYWFSQQTTGYEAMFYIGTVPLILAFVGLIDFGRGRARTWFWRLVIAASLALATMPRWWLDGYALVLSLPGLGYFRAPARYTLLASFGLSLLAGQGFDRAASAVRFRAGLALALVFALCAFGFALIWADHREFRSLSGPGGLPFGFVTGGLTWGLAFGAVMIWRSGKVGAWLPGLVAAAELSALYYLGPTEWGWAVKLPQQSPVLSALAVDKDGGRVGGVVHDLPLQAGRGTAMPYLGMTLTPINRLMYSLQERTASHGPEATLWQRRLGVTRSVWDEPVSFDSKVPTEAYDDPALDLIAHRPVGKTNPRRWRVVRHDDPFPEARVALTARTATAWPPLVDHLSRNEAREEAWFLPGDAPADDPGGPRAHTARVASWDGRSGVVEHDGTCDLVLTRTYDENWRASVNDGPDRPVLRVDGGLQAVRLVGPGPSKVSLRYRPAWLRTGLTVSSSAIVAALILVAASLIRTRRGEPDGA